MAASSTPTSADDAETRLNLILIDTCGGEGKELGKRESHSEFVGEGTACASDESPDLDVKRFCQQL